MTYQPTGLSTEDIKKYAQSAVTAATISKQILDDPYLDEFVCQLRRYQDAAPGRPAPLPCPSTVATAAQIAKGTGLKHAIVPVKALVFNKRYPGVLPALAIGGVALIFYAGVLAGKRR